MYILALVCCDFLLYFVNFCIVYKSISALTCTPLNSRHCSIASYHQRPLLSGGAHLTPGLTRSVVRQSALSGIWNCRHVFTVLSHSKLESTATSYAKRREYHALLRRNRESFWWNKIDAEKSKPHQLWRSVDTLLWRG